MRTLSLLSKKHFFPKWRISKGIAREASPIWRISKGTFAKYRDMICDGVRILCLLFSAQASCCNWQQTPLNLTNNKVFRCVYSLPQFTATKYVFVLRSFAKT